MLLVLIVVAAALVVWDVRRGADSSRLRDAAGRVFAPAERGLTTLVDPIRAGIRSATGEDQRQNLDELTAENLRLRLQAAVPSQVLEQESALYHLGLMSLTYSVRVEPARVIATGDTTGSERTVDIGAGSGRGIRAGQLVVDTDGLIGVVIRVTSVSATVRLADDSRTVIGARLIGSGALGILTGDGSARRLTFRLFDPTLKVRSGERVVTYGSADYPAGIPVGETTSSGVLGVGGEGSALTQTLPVSPYAKYGSLDLVGVVVAPAGS